MTMKDKRKVIGEICETTLLTLTKTNRLLILSVNTGRDLKSRDASQPDLLPLSHLAHAPPLREMCLEYLRGQDKSTRCLPLSRVIETADMDTEKGSAKDKTLADGFFDHVDKYLDEELPILFTPVKGNVKDHDAVLYIPPKCGDWAQALVSKANESQVGTTVDWTRGTLISLQIKSGDRIGHDGVEEYYLSINLIRTKLEKRSNKPNVFGLVVAFGNSTALTSLRLTEAVADGKIALVSESTAKSYSLYPNLDPEPKA